MKLPAPTLKRHLIIGFVGQPNSGRTAAACFLFDALYDSGVRNIKHKDSLIDESKPSIILFEPVDTIEKATSILDSGGILIHILRGHNSPYIGNHYHWHWKCKAQIVVTNDGDLRRFDFQMLDVLKNQLPQLKQWKETIN